MKTRRLAREFAARLFDITVALSGLIVLSPLFAVAALVIWLEDGRPIIFRQARIGMSGRPFLILKFRTMRSEAGGPAITARGDRRITRAGAWLRRFKIDELPQLINVLSGEMGLIGPRPEVPEFVEADNHLWREVLGVRPGITDLASLTFRNEETILGEAANPAAHYRSVILPEKLRLNLQYQRSRSLSRDVKLLWMTGRYSFFPRGFSRERILRLLGS
jgi:lipopolysaccharide/colanic/teichoic acid biosynthesis glycosyltransferase